MRRHTRREAVYWPAFADILTALVVVLIWFVVAKPGEKVERFKKDGNAVAAPAATPTDDPREEIAKTLSEYEEDVRQSRMLQLAAGLQGMQGLRFERQVAQVCSDIGAVHVDDIEPGCERKLDELPVKEFITKLKEAERQAGLGPVRIQVQSMCRSGCTSYSRVKELEARAESILRGVDNDRTLPSKYEEREKARPGINLVLSCSLTTSEVEEIKKKWKANDIDWLKKNLQYSKRPL
jgi:hypothetical protein